MAKLTVGIKEVEITVVRDEKVYILELSEKEAMVLHKILRHVGGSPHSSARKYADGISSALCSSNVGYYDDKNDPFAHMNKGLSSLVFLNDEELVKE